MPAGESPIFSPAAFAVAIAIAVALFWAQGRLTQYNLSHVLTHTNITLCLFCAILQAFQRVAVSAESSKLVTIVVTKEDMSFQDDSSAVGVWRPVSGNYQIRVGASSLDDTLTQDIDVSF